MAKQLLIKAKPRENKKPNLLRREGFIPATVYGHGFVSESIQINAKEFSNIPQKVYSHINQLEIEGKEKYPILIREVHVDPVMNNYLNIEFYRIKSDEKIKVKVPLNYIGHSAAVIAGGVLIVSYNEIEIQCLPNDIPDAIDVNLERITEIGQSILAKDLKVSENIQVITRQEEVLAKVEIAKTHEIEEAKVEVPEGVTPTEAAPAVQEAAPGVAGVKEVKEAPSASKQAAPPPSKPSEGKGPKK